MAHGVGRDLCPGTAFPELNSHGARCSCDARGGKAARTVRLREQSASGEATTELARLITISSNCAANGHSPASRLHSIRTSSPPERRDRVS
jgi:hypothetical protein